MKDIETFLWDIGLRFLISSGIALLITAFFAFKTRKDPELIAEARYKTRERLDKRREALGREMETSKEAEEEYWKLGEDLSWENETETITHELPTEIRRKLDHINTVSGALRFVGGLFTLAVFIFLLVSGLWIAALIYGIFALAMGVSIDSHKGDGLIEAIGAIIFNAILVTIMLFGAQFWYTNTPPKTGLATYSVTMQEKQDGSYAPEGEQFKLVSVLSKSNKQGYSHYAWSEGLSNGTVRTVTNYARQDENPGEKVKKNLDIIEDLPEGAEPYVTHEVVFNVLQGKDKDTPLCTKDSYTLPCSHRNAWTDSAKATVHLPKGKYADYVKIDTAA